MTEVPCPHADYGYVFRAQWERLKKLKGDVAEFGVYRGGTARQLATLTGRTVFAFDTFTGMPAQDFNPDLDHDQPGGFDPEATAEELFSDCPTIFPVVGRFADTLPKVPANQKFVLVYIDCDLYASCKQVLDWLPAHLTDGAVLVFDDYVTHAGIRKAVNEWLLAHDDDTNFYRLTGPGVYVEWRCEA